MMRWSSHVFSQPEEKAPALPGSRRVEFALIRQVDGIGSAGTAVEKLSLRERTKKPAASHRLH